MMISFCNREMAKREGQESNFAYHAIESFAMMLWVLLIAGTALDVHSLFMGDGDRNRQRIFDQDQQSVGDDVNEPINPGLR